MRVWASALVVWIVLCGFGCEQRTRQFDEPSVWTTLKSDDVVESSGIAPSRVHPGHFWTHNDDGEVLEAFRFDASGRVVKWTMRSIANRDCEDMASATLGGRHYLYIADIGDNARRWPSIRVYRFEEPSAPSSSPKVETYELSYHDGAHNAEAFMVDPRTGAFWIVEKTGSGPAAVFECREPKVGAGNALVKVGEVKVGESIQGSRLITGGAISADGRHLVLRTYLAAYEYPYGPAWHKAEPTRIRTGIEGQGEAITYSLGGDALFTTSEGKPCPVTRIPLQAGS